MSSRWPALIAALVVQATAGCSVYSLAWRNAVTEPSLYCEEKDREASYANYRALADQAWAESGSTCPDDCTAADFSWGFREGFSQYVYAGGTGEPPATPPRVYWQTDLRTHEGARAVRSYFEGYRLGSRVAREGGYRDAVTLKLSASLRDCDECGCPDEGDDGRAAPAFGHSAPAGTAPAEERAPTPAEVLELPPVPDERLEIPNELELPEPAPNEAPDAQRSVSEPVPLRFPSVRRAAPDSTKPNSKPTTEWRNGLKRVADEHAGRSGVTPPRPWAGEIEMPSAGKQSDQAKPRVVDSVSERQARPVSWVETLTATSADARSAKERGDRKTDSTTVTK